MKKKICIIAQFPPPVHGLSKAVDVLYKSNISKKYKLEKVNITLNKLFLFNVIKILFSNADMFYLTISSSVLGNLRDIVILFLVYLKGKKSVIHLHGGYYRKLVENDMTNIQKRVNYFIVSKQDGAIVLGEKFKDIFKGMIDDSKIFVIPNGVESYFIPDENTLWDLMKKRKQKTMRILYLSNFIEEKGYKKVLLLANYINKNTKEKIYFDFAGKFYNDEKKYFFDYIANNKLKKIVNYHGIVEGEKKKKLLEEASVFILITHYKKEGQPISILEAMANGLYIITTDFSGIGEVVKNGKNGNLVSQDVSSETLYDLINGMKKNQENVGINNNDIVLSKYTQKVYLQKMSKAFDDILKK